MASLKKIITKTSGNPGISTTSIKSFFTGSLKEFKISLIWI